MTRLGKLAVGIEGRHSTGRVGRDVGGQADRACDCEEGAGAGPRRGEGEGGGSAEVTVRRATIAAPRG